LKAKFRESSIGRGIGARSRRAGMIAKPNLLANRVGLIDLVGFD
jgi:hypothetical protein